MTERASGMSFSFMAILVQSALAKPVEKHLITANYISKIRFANDFQTKLPENGRFGVSARCVGCGGSNMASSLTITRVQYRSSARAQAADAALVPRAPVDARLEMRPELSRLYFAVAAARTGDDALILQFVGVTGGEGVSTIAAAFARRGACEAGNAILLIACGEDGRNIGADVAALPSLLDLFLAGRALDGALAAVRGEDTALGLERLRRARLGQAALDALTPRTLVAFAEELRRDFSVIVLDSPPPARSSIAGTLSSIADGTIVVAAAGVSRRRGIERTVAAITSMGGQVTGLVLNRRREWLPAWLRRRMA